MITYDPNYWAELLELEFDTTPIQFNWPSIIWRGALSLWALALTFLVISL